MRGAAVRARLLGAVPSGDRFRTRRGLVRRRVRLRRLVGDGGRERPGLRRRSVLAGHLCKQRGGAVVEKAGCEMVGRVGCLNPEGWPGFEIGWTLRREFWGQGYATEAARAAFDWAFEKLGMPHIISLIAPSNTRSIRVAERLGEVLEGKTRVLDMDVLVYGIGAEDWLQRRML